MHAINQQIFQTFVNHCLKVDIMIIILEYLYYYKIFINKLI